MTIENLAKFQAALELLKHKHKFEPVVVGYTQNYAVWVHENLEAYHETGQAKFLEAPMRRLQDELASEIRSEVAKSGNLQKALLKAGLRLQRESQKLVPVLTGALRASAFTCKEKDLEEASLKAFQISEGVKKVMTGTKKDKKK
jgi:hypothetical protein